MTATLSSAARDFGGVEQSTSPEAGWPSYHAARLAYGAADALVAADAWSHEPILADAAREHRAKARQALVEAIAELDAVQ
jgi:hypothetical protein